MRGPKKIAGREPPERKIYFIHEILEFMECMRLYIERWAGKKSLNV